MRTCYIQHGGKGGQGSGPGFPDNAPECFQTKYQGYGLGTMSFNDDWCCFFTAGSGTTESILGLGDGPWGYVTQSGVVGFGMNKRYAQNFGIVACVPRVDLVAEPSTDYEGALHLAKELVTSSRLSVGDKNYSIVFGDTTPSKAGANSGRVSNKANIWMGVEGHQNAGYGAFIDAVAVNPTVPAFTSSGNRFPVPPMNADWNLQTGDFYPFPIFNSSRSPVWTYSNVTSDYHKNVYWYHAPQFDKSNNRLNGVLIPAGGVLDEYQNNIQWKRFDFNSSISSFSPMRYTGADGSIYRTPFILTWVIVLPSEVDFNG